MNPTLKKGLKITAISIGSLLVLILGAIAILVNFIFTPEKITPVVKEVAAKYIDAEVKLASVELTFFSTFPNFGLALKECEVTPANSPKSLLSLSEAVFVLNPIAFLNNKEIKVSRLYLNDPRFYLYIDSTGRSNLEILKTTTTTDTTTAGSASDTTDYKIEIRRVHIHDGEMTLDDRSTQLYSDMRNIHLTLDGNLSRRKGNIAFDFSADSILLWQKGEVVFKKIALGIKSEAGFDKDSSLLRLGRTVVDLNGLKLGAKGTITGDTIRKTAEVHLGFGLHTPSLANLLTLLPSNMVEKDREITTSGEVLLTGRLDGVYGKGQVPELEAELSIEKATAKYSGMTWGIDELTTKAKLYVDLSNKRPSYLDLDNFVFRGSGGATHLTLSGRVDNLLDNPQIRFHVINDLNLDNLSKIFPFHKGVEFGGSNKSDFRGKLALNDIKRGDYARISIGGTSDFHDLKVIIDGSQLADSSNSYLYIMMKHGAFNLDSKGGLNGSINFNGLGFRDKKGAEIFMQDIGMSIKSRLSADTTQVSEMESQLVLGGIKLDIADTLKSHLSKSTLTLEIHPYAENKRRAVITTTLQTDSLHFNAIQTDTKASLSVARIQGQLISPEEKKGKWELSGSLGFRNLNIFSALFPIEINIPSTRLTYRQANLILRGTRMRVGESEMIATGQIDSLMKTILGEGTILKGRLNIRSQMIDFDPILTAMNNSSANQPDSTILTAAVIKPDSSATSKGSTSGTEDDMSLTLFEIPKGIDFKLDVDIDKAKIAGLNGTNIHGNIDLNNGSARLSNLSMEVAGAQMQTSALYRTTNKKRASIGMNLNIEKVDISRLGEIVPSIDTLLPMLKSFKGIVDVSLVARSRLDSTLRFDLKSLTSIIHLHGTNLVVLDNDTFKTLSKMLMFKNKERNMIDSLSANVVVRDGNVEVLPFEATLDRYRVIIGGSQDFDMNFKYNVSIMKSPLPFKAGVDIFGNLDDFDFKITKAKLKKTDFGLQQVNIDSARQSMIRRQGLVLVPHAHAEQDSTLHRRPRREIPPRDSTAH